MGSEEVDDRLVVRFQEAVEHARAGRHAQALTVYQLVLVQQREEDLVAAPRFIATTRMQAAYALMDLGRLDEAEGELAEVDPYAFGGQQRYDFYFTKANVFGGLGKVREMFSSFVEAISVAEDLDDYSERPEKCWMQILSFTVRAEQWEYLREVADKAKQVADVRGFPKVRDAAVVAIDMARTELAKAH